MKKKTKGFHIGRLVNRLVNDKNRCMHINLHCFVRTDACFFLLFTLSISVSLLYTNIP